MPSTNAPRDTKRKDTGDETFSVTSRAHGQCDESWSCKSMDCLVPRKPSAGLSGIAGMVRRAYAAARGLFRAGRAPGGEECYPRKATGGGSEEVATLDPTPPRPVSP